MVEVVKSVNSDLGTNSLMFTIGQKTPALIDARTYNAIGIACYDVNIKCFLLQNDVLFTWLTMLRTSYGLLREIITLKYPLTKELQDLSSRKRKVRKHETTILLLTVEFVISTYECVSQF